MNNDNFTEIERQNYSCSLDRKAAHALNNIFSTIIANAELLEEELGQDNRCLQRLHLACNNGLELVRELRTSSGERQESPRMSFDPACLQSLRLLVIDDEEGIVGIVTRYMEKYGVVVHGFTSGRAALHYFRNHAHAIDCVVTDLEMPVISGMEICRMVKSERPKIPVIVITGYDREPTEEQVVDLGVAEVLLKPFSRQKLVAALCRVLLP